VREAAGGAGGEHGEAAAAVVQAVLDATVPLDRFRSTSNPVIGPGDYVRLTDSVEARMRARICFITRALMRSLLHAHS